MGTGRQRLGGIGMDVTQSWEGLDMGNEIKEKKKLLFSVCTLRKSRLIATTTSLSSDEDTQLLNLTNLYTLRQNRPIAMQRSIYGRTYGKFCRD